MAVQGCPEFVPLLTGTVIKPPNNKKESDFFLAKYTPMTYSLLCFLSKLLSLQN
jgi:hypothetical protein